MAMRESKMIAFGIKLEMAPQPIAQLEELEGVRVRRDDELSTTVAVFLRRDRVLGFSMDDRDATEMALVLAGYYRLTTGQELNVEREREPITEDIAPPYLSQHNVVPMKWSYLQHDDPMVLSKKHYAIFSMPPPYHSLPSQSKSNLDTNMNTSITNRNHSASSSPLTGYDSKPGLLGYDIHFEKCKRGEEFRLFDPHDALYLDDGMGFDLQSVLSMELLENVDDNPKLVEARNEQVIKRVAEMQKLVENSEQYLTEHRDETFGDSDVHYQEGILKDEFVGKETSVDQTESDTESNNSKMSSADDAPGILKHSDSLLLLTETINQGLSGLNVPVMPMNKDNNSDILSRRESQGLSAILNNCGLTDALIALNNDMSQSESDNDSLYTPNNSPIRRNHNKGTNKVIRTSFGIHSPETAQHDGKEQNLKEYLKQLRERSSREEEIMNIPCVEVNTFLYQDDQIDQDAELIDLTLIPPPQTPDELDTSSQVPQILPVVPPSFADDKTNNVEIEAGVDVYDSASPPVTALEEFIANVTIQPPTVKVTPAIELTPEEIMSYIIPPPPVSNTSTLVREPVTYVNQTQIISEQQTEINTNNDVNSSTSNGDIVKGTLSVSEIRNMFTAKSLSEARNSLLLRERNNCKSQQQHCKTSESSKGKRKSITSDKPSNGSISNAPHVIEYPTVERKGMFSCCSKDKTKEDSDENDDKTGNQIVRSDSIPDVCEIRPPPRRRNLENDKPPERPPKTAPIPAPRPRSNSFSHTNMELTAVEITTNHFSTLNNRKLTYKVVCETNEQNVIEPSCVPPQLPPRLENKVLSPPPPLLLPPKKPPLPPVPSFEVLRMKNAQKFGTSSLRNPNEQRLASIGSPHFQRNLTAYKNIENEGRLDASEYSKSNGHVRQQQTVNFQTLQNRHVRSNSETKNTIMKNNEMSTVLTLCSPQMNRRLSNRPDLLNGAPCDRRVFSPPLAERRISRRDSASPTLKSQNHVRFKEDVVDDIPTPPSPPAVKFAELCGNNGHVSVEALLRKSEAAVAGLLQRLRDTADKCSHQHAHGGGEDIDEIKFQRARTELTTCAVSLVGAGRTLVGALGAGGAGAPQALADCLTPLRRLADLAQALGRHTSAPLQTRNLVLRVHDVTAAFKDLAGAEMADIFREHISGDSRSDTKTSLEGQLALRAECLANVLATLLRSLRVFSPEVAVCLCVGYVSPQTGRNNLTKSKSFLIRFERLSNAEKRRVARHRRVSARRVGDASALAENKWSCGGMFTNKESAATQLGARQERVGTPAMTPAAARTRIIYRCRIFYLKALSVTQTSDSQSGPGGPPGVHGRLAGGLRRREQKMGVHKVLMEVHENLSAFDSKNVLEDFYQYLLVPEKKADKQLPMCLLCNKVLSNDSMKPSKLEDHLKRCHTDKIGKDLKYFQTLKEKYEKRPTMHSMIASTSQSNDDGLRASYNISLLTAKSGKPHTIGGQLILPAVEEVLKTVLHKSPFDVLKRIPLVATDGVPAMVGRYRGFISHLKRIIPGLTAIHCVIHRQHLVAKHLSERLNQSLHFVIKAVNKMRSNALNTRLFAQLCDENDEDFQRLLLHTEVRWLSKGACLTRFYSVLDSVLEFLESRDPDLKENLIKFKTGIAYLTDLFKKFNDINLQLQGDSLNLIKSKGIISDFLGKLKFMKQNISRQEFSQFPNLSQVECIDEDIHTYSQHLSALHDDFKTRFEDIQTMDIPPWIINPFDETEVANVVLQEELLELSTNEELKAKFRKGYQTFWLQAEIPEKYPGLWEIARKFLIAFPSSYLVKRSFSAVTNLLTKPNIDRLLTLHQIHPSQ
ncbi:SCAN domain-containing protein 3 [Eumeta japonica]|uniref:SCAN domain-containing protein 3 n=1 Tax=Eumeta variegata TaxID=151549 RepID=A0A4C1VM85_EUMVA|nr:SCAN domain-containing protein 3 [Eumeta japonica]